MDDEKFINWLDSAVVRDLAISEGGLGFDSRAGQIEHSVSYGSPPLRLFFRSCVAQALSDGDGPTGLTLRRNTASIMKMK